MTRPESRLAAMLAGTFAWRRGRGSTQMCGGVLTAADCREGFVGSVVDVTGGNSLAARLREIGVVPGSRIQIKKSGNPIVFQLEGGRYCIRKRDARCITVCAD